MIVNFAAESHVDRSIDNPLVFVNSNILGVHNLLEICKNNLKDFKFIQISTDEVFGSLGFNSKKAKKMIVINLHRHTQHPKRQQIF